MSGFLFFFPWPVQLKGLIECVCVLANLEPTLKMNSCVLVGVMSYNLSLMQLKTVQFTAVIGHRASLYTCRKVAFFLYTYK